MIGAAKDEMLSGLASWCADLPLAATVELAENSHLGVGSKNPALYLGIEWSKSTLALGLPEWSGKTASGHAVAANNGQQIATLARPTWKGKNNTCLAKFNGTFLGKFDNFFSPLSMIPGIGPDWKSSIAEDVGGGAAKYTIFKFFQAAGNNWGGTGLGAIGKGVSGAIEGVAEGVGAPLVVGATLDQVSAHIACAIVSF